jgi:putative autotransporter adhesin-like protein
MKKTFVFSAVLTLLTISSFATGNNNGEPVITKPSKLSTLIVDANVSIVLVKNDNGTAALSGDEKFTKNITFRKTGDTLVIGYVKNRDYKEKGVVYVSANQLKNIKINSSARVRSVESLRIPKLDVVINGTCEFSISNVGELNLSGTKNFDFEEVRQERIIPAGWSF